MLDMCLIVNDYCWHLYWDLCHLPVSDAFQELQRVSMRLVRHPLRKEGSCPTLRLVNGESAVRLSCLLLNGTGWMPRSQFPGKLVGVVEYRRSKPFAENSLGSFSCEAINSECRSGEHFSVEAANRHTAARQS